MRKILNFILVILFFHASAEATTKFRCPTSSCGGISAWFDHNRNTGSLLRYDGATSFQYDNHDGIDYARSSGTSIYAGAKGELYYRVSSCPEDGSYQSCGGGFGNHVRIKHPDGHVTIYAHMKKNSPVYYGSYLCGARVGYVGLSGKTSGYHVHFGLWSDTSKSKILDFYGGKPNGNVSYWVNYNSPSTACQ